MKTKVFTEIAGDGGVLMPVAKTDLTFELVLCNRIQCTSDEIQFECNI